MTYPTKPNRNPDIIAQYANKHMNLWINDITDESNVEFSFTIYQNGEEKSQWEDGTCSLMRIRNNKLFFSHDHDFHAPSEWNRPLEDMTPDIVLQAYQKYIKEVVEQQLLDT